MELDYKAMFETMYKRLEEAKKADEEYFALLALIHEKSKYITAISEKLMTLPKSDQLMLFRLHGKVAQMSEYLCKKHDLLEDSECNM